MGVGVYAAVKFPFTANDNTKTFRAYVSHAFLRQITKSLTIRQIQSVLSNFIVMVMFVVMVMPLTHVRLTTTGTSYNEFAKSREIVPYTSHWGETGHGFWVGSSSAPYVLVWFHGMLRTLYK